jgi:hypothetical protein
VRQESEVELARRAAAGPPPHCGESETSASERRVCSQRERRTRERAELQPACARISTLDALALALIDQKTNCELLCSYSLTHLLACTSLYTMLRVSRVELISNITYHQAQPARSSIEIDHSLARPQRKNTSRPLLATLNIILMHMLSLG